MVEANSALVDVFAEHWEDWLPSDTDLESWVEIELAGRDGWWWDTTATHVGLFGVDLADFLDTCAIATENCDVSSYDAYSGWAVGVKWTPATSTLLRAVVDGKINTLVFSDRLVAVQVTWNAAGNTLIQSAVDVDEITYDVPGANDIADDEEEGPFDSFDGQPSDSTGPQYAIHFQEDEADIYYEVDSTSSVWAYYENGVGVETEVTWAGATAQLTAAAVFAVALLF